MTFFFEQRCDRRLDLVMVKRVLLGQFAFEDELQDQAFEGAIGEPEAMVALAVPVVRPSAGLALSIGCRPARRIELGSEITQPVSTLWLADTAGGDGEMGESLVGEREHTPL